MAVIHELNNPIAVNTPKGDGKCIAWIDYGPETNTVWKVRMEETGRPINFFDDDILIYPNPMNGEKNIKPFHK